MISLQARVTFAAILAAAASLPVPTYLAVHSCAPVAES